MLIKITVAFHKEFFLKKMIQGLEVFLEFRALFLEPTADSVAQLNASYH